MILALCLAFGLSTGPTTTGTAFGACHSFGLGLKPYSFTVSPDLRLQLQYNWRGPLFPPVYDLGLPEWAPEVSRNPLLLPSFANLKALPEPAPDDECGQFWYKSGVNRELLPPLLKECLKLRHRFRSGVILELTYPNFTIYFP